ncbi:MAG: hypothetical protein ABIG30_03870 [Candidatus Aenigmatarchaeota archaeon]
MELTEMMPKAWIAVLITVIIFMVLMLIASNAISAATEQFGVVGV